MTAQHLPASIRAPSVGGALHFAHLTRSLDRDAYPPAPHPSPGQTPATQRKSPGRRTGLPGPGRLQAATVDQRARRLFSGLAVLRDRRRAADPSGQGRAAQDTAYPMAAAMGAELPTAGPGFFAVELAGPFLTRAFSHANTLVTTLSSSTAPGRTLRRRPGFVALGDRPAGCATAHRRRLRLCRHGQCHPAGQRTHRRTARAGKPAGPSGRCADAHRSAPLPGGTRRGQGVAGGTGPADRPERTADRRPTLERRGRACRNRAGTGTGQTEW